MELSRSLGQYFTPPEVVDLAFTLLSWLQPDVHGGRALDLACGEGAFLLGALRHGFAGSHLYGLDADPRLPGLWAEGGLAAAGTHLAVTDGLIGGGEGLFEVVVGNPPFGGQWEPGENLGLAWQYGWWRLGGRKGPALPRELWFLERSLRLLAPGGLLALVLPEGFLANSRWRAQRQALVVAHQIEAVLGLPRNVFRASRAAVKTVLLLARRQPPAAGHRVRLAELEAADLASPHLAATLLEHWQHGRPLSTGRPWEAGC